MYLSTIKAGREERCYSCYTVTRLQGLLWPLPLPPSDNHKTQHRPHYHSTIQVGANACISVLKRSFKTCRAQDDLSLAKLPSILLSKTLTLTNSSTSS